MSAMLRLASSASEASEVLSAQFEPKKTPLVEVQLHREAQKEWQAPQGVYGVMLFAFFFHRYFGEDSHFLRASFHQMGFVQNHQTG